MGLSRDLSRATPKMLADKTEEMLKQVQHDSGLDQNDNELVQADNGEAGNDIK